LKLRVPNSKEKALNLMDGVDGGGGGGVDVGGLLEAELAWLAGGAAGELDEEELVLSYRTLGAAEAEQLGAALLAAPRRVVGALRVLDLHSNRLRSAGARAVARALPALPALCTLTLNLNGIGDAGARALAEAICGAGGGAGAAMLSLEALWLGNNGIGEHGARALEAAVHCLPGEAALRSVWLVGNGAISEPTLARMAALLEGRAPRCGAHAWREFEAAEAEAERAAAAAAAAAAALEGGVGQAADQPPAEPTPAELAAHFRRHFAARQIEFGAGAPTAPAAAPPPAEPVPRGLAPAAAREPAALSKALLRVLPQVHNNHPLLAAVSLRAARLAQADAVALAAALHGNSTLTSLDVRANPGIGEHGMTLLRRAVDGCPALTRFRA
jgi:hypothetical protein